MEEQANASSELTPGQLLRTARAAANLTQENIAAQLHLNVRVIQNLENDRYSADSSLVFMKGYLRSYSKILNIPQQQMMEAFKKLGLETPKPISAAPASLESEVKKADVFVSPNSTFVKNFLRSGGLFFNALRKKLFNPTTSADTQVRKMTAIAAVVLVIIIFTLWQLHYKSDAESHTPVLNPATSTTVATTIAPDMSATVAPAVSGHPIIAAMQSQLSAAESVIHNSKPIVKPEPITPAVQNNAAEAGSGPSLHMDLGNE